MRTLLDRPCLTIGLLLALATPASAAPKGLPARVVECGQVITESLRLANPLRDCADAGLVVGAPNITIDLGGHRIEGSGTGAGVDNSAGHDGVTIRNGIVSDFPTGIHLEGASGNRLESLLVRGNELGVRLVGSTGNTIRGVSARDGGEGIRLEDLSNDNSLAANDASSNATSGFRIVESTGNTLAGNTAFANVQFGFSVSLSNDTELKANAARGNVETGFFVSGTVGAVLNRNVASGNGVMGIVVQGGEGAELVRNTADENGVSGITLTNAATLRGNRASGNGFAGGGPGDDIGLGIFATADSTSVGNRASGNDDPRECTPEELGCRPAPAGPQKLPARIVACGDTITESIRVANPLLDCSGDGLVIGAPGITIDLGGHRIDGIDLDGSAGIDDSGGHDRVEIRNGIVSDFADGILVSAVEGVTVTGVRVVGNRDGIHLLAASRSAIRGNTAHGNVIGINLENGSDENALAANDASGNSIDGFYVFESAGNALSGNLANANGTYGLEIFTAVGSVLRKNVANGNDTDGIIVDVQSSDTVVKGNRASGNGLHGIEVFSGTGNVLTKNTADENAVTGIRAAVATLTLRGNRANGNGLVNGGPGDDVGLGIDVPAGTIETGSKAAGNDDPNECESAEVSCHVLP
jgi:parallel beta-helix repeat protein